MLQEEMNLITEEEQAILAEKLALPQRTEEDWARVKEILSVRNVVVMKPRNRNIPHRGPMTLDHGELTAFTSIEKCVAYIKATTPNESYEIGTIPFLEAIDFAQQRGLRLDLDVSRTGPFYSYRRQELAVTLRIARNELPSPLFPGKKRLDSIEK